MLLAHFVPQRAQKWEPVLRGKLRKKTTGAKVGTGFARKVAQKNNGRKSGNRFCAESCAKKQRA
jgi:hypothetical protein